MPFLRRTPHARSPAGTLAIAFLAVAFALPMQNLGWGQTSQLALVKSLSHGTPKIDRYHWETRDKSYYRGHYYSVKSPGLSLLTLPLYKLVDKPGWKASTWAARNSIEHGASRWHRGLQITNEFGFDPKIAAATRATVENESALAWFLGLLGTVAPTIALVLLVRFIGDRLAPGFGTAAGVAAGLGTLLLPFSGLFFSHALAACLGFAAFVVLWVEREGEPRVRRVALAGALAGLAITCEYPLALVAAIVGVYALARPDRLRRALAYGGGAVAGLLPLFGYNLWAFGKPIHSGYADAVAIQGASGHDVLGLNSSGFFGIGAPNLRVATQLLFSAKGLLITSPLLALGIAGTVLLYRRGKRAEALLIAAVAVAYLVYNAGYYLPFGGGSPGPRFLIPVIPFLCAPLALAFKRWPAAMLGLAVASTVTLATATLTMPLIGNQDVGYWGFLARNHSFENTFVTVLGHGRGWLAISPFIAAVLAAAVFAARATAPVRIARRDLLGAVIALTAWAGVAATVPDLLGRGDPDVGHTSAALALVAVSLASGLLAVLLAAAFSAGARGRAPRRRAPRGEAAAP
ncbi:MAG: hypothetical protein ACJ76V_12845 [Thermoleophilaceae bacterium]